LDAIEVAGLTETDSEKSEELVACAGRAKKAKIRIRIGINFMLDIFFVITEFEVGPFGCARSDLETIIGSLPKSTAKPE